MSRLKRAWASGWCLASESINERWELLKMIVGLLNELPESLRSKVFELKTPKEINLTKFAQVQYDLC